MPDNSLPDFPGSEMRSRLERISYQLMQIKVSTEITDSWME